VSSPVLEVPSVLVPVVLEDEPVVLDPSEVSDPVVGVPVVSSVVGPTPELELELVPSVPPPPAASSPQPRARRHNEDQQRRREGSMAA
jgi:hypothetical protein